MPRISRRKWGVVLAVGVTCTFLGLFAYYYFAVRGRLDLSNLPSYSVEQLIDGLQYESSEGLGTHSTAWADGFLAGDDEPVFRGGVLGSAKPSISPVMRELASRGVAALPALMAHLDDRRATCLEIKLPFGGFGGMWHSDEYEPRYFEENKGPAGVNKGRGITERHIDRSYRVRVGDLCYVLFGQVVNRHLNVVRYQPSACIVINSPVETPALAEAVKADWAGLTSKQHERSLIEDSKSDSEYFVAAALARLKYYYPEAAARVAPKAP